MKNKNKKSKLIAISLLALCFSMLAFGVYALKQATLQVQGTVGFRAHDCMVRVSATIQGDAVVNGTPDADGSPSAERTFFEQQVLGTNSQNQTKTLTAPQDIDEIYFSDLTENGAPHEILITFNISNDSFYPITATISNTMLTNTAVRATIETQSVTLDAKDGQNDEATLTVAYNLDATEVDTGVYDYVDFEDFAYSIGLNFAKYNAPAQQPEPQEPQESIDVPTNVALSGDALSFTATEDATSYEVAYFSGENFISSYEINSNEATLANKPANAGTYAVKVRAKKVENQTTTYSDYVIAGNVVVEELTGLKISSSTEIPNAVGEFAFIEVNDSQTGELCAYRVGLSTNNLADEVVFPAMHEGYPVISIGYFVGYSEGLFSNVTSVVVPYGVTSIENYAFRYFTGLENITLPSTVTSIGMQSFTNCTSLTNVNLGSNINSLGEGAFTGCSNLEVVTSNAASLTVESSVFEDCTALEVVDISGLQSYSNALFRNCSSLQQVTVPSNLQQVNLNTFYSCTSLESIILPSSCTILKESAFSNCTSLQNITMPGVTEIEYNALGDCNSLFNLELPNTLSKLNTYSIKAANGKFIIPSSLTTVQSYALAYGGIQAIYFSTDSIPAGWGSDWTWDGCEIYYNYTYDSFLDEDITNISLTKVGDDYIASFDAVQGATSYLISYVDDSGQVYKNRQTISAQNFNGSVVLDVPEAPYNTIVATFVIEAVKEDNGINYYSNRAKIGTITVEGITISVPTGISFDPNTKELSFNSVENADYYCIMYEQYGGYVDEYNFSETSVVLSHIPNSPGTYTVKLRATKNFAVYSDFVTVGEIVVE